MYAPTRSVWNSYISDKKKRHLGISITSPTIAGMKIKATGVGKYLKMLMNF